ISFGFQPSGIRISHGGLHPIPLTKARIYDPAHMKKITVLLVDDHTVVREGLRALLGVETDIEVIAEAADGREALALAKETSPDVVVMDVAMPIFNGMEATRQIVKNCPDTAVLVLSSYTHEECVQQLLK